MRFLFANLNKRLGGEAARHRCEAWLDEVQCDFFLTQEPWTLGRTSHVDLKGFNFIGGNSNTGLWIREKYLAPVSHQYQDKWQMIDLGYLQMHNIYLSPYSSKDRSSSLRELTEFITANNHRPTIVVGDFNLAPQPQDGLHGNTESKWTSTEERKSFESLLNRAFLIDATSRETLGSQQYSISRNRQGAQISFRCDLALISDYIVQDITVTYDHSIREGIDAFTDHSAVCIDVPVSLPEATLFGNLFEEASSESYRQDSYKTAIPRKGPSTVARKLYESKLLTRHGVHSVFDFGCGFGQDVSFYRSVGMDADGYDQYKGFGWISLPEKTYDLVTITFVLNVISDPWQRFIALEQATARVSATGIICIAARSQKCIFNEVSKKGWPKFNDGYWSHEGKGTFQKGITKTEIAAMVKRLGFEILSHNLNVGSDVEVLMAKRIV